MMRFLLGYVLGRHREARAGCGVVLILMFAVVASFAMIITGNA
jgi:hypothetical protein